MPAAVELFSLLEIQSAHLRTLRRYSRRRAAACAHGDQPSAYSRRDDRSAHPRIPHRRERLRGARRATSRKVAASRGISRCAARFRQGGELSDRPQAALRRASGPPRRDATIPRWRPASSRRRWPSSSATSPREHGRVPGGRAIVLGLGKLGSREMTAASDLDLILIYDFDRERPESDGARPLHAVQYYTRIAQRLVVGADGRDAARRALSGRYAAAPLRQQGSAGDAAAQLHRLSEQRGRDLGAYGADARARCIAGDAGLAAETERRDPRRADARAAQELSRATSSSMRKLIASVKGDQDRWDLKLAAGGLIDIEFLAQYLLLRHAHRSSVADRCLDLRRDRDRGEARTDRGRRMRRRCSPPIA